MDAFLQRKAVILENLTLENDKSPKGSVDAPIVELVNFINSSPKFVTTSSCSGRVAVYLGGESSGRWLYVTHESSELPGPENIGVWINATISNSGGDCPPGLVYFKFEPFIMHIEAKDLESAKMLHQLSTSCGYRNSGLTVSSKRVMVAIRSSLKIDAPIAEANSEGGISLLVSPQYIARLVELSREKFKENQKRIEQLFAALRKAV